MKDLYEVTCQTEIPPDLKHHPLFYIKCFTTIILYKMFYYIRLSTRFTFKTSKCSKWRNENFYSIYPLQVS